MITILLLVISGRRVGRSRRRFGGSGKIHNFFVVVIHEERRRGDVVVFDLDTRHLFGLGFCFSFGFEVLVGSRAKQDVFGMSAGGKGRSSLSVLFFFHLTPSKKQTK